MEKVDESEDRKRGWRGGKKAAWCQVLREGHCDESASSNDAHICYIILPALPGQEFTTTPPPWHEGRSLTRPCPRFFLRLDGACISRRHSPAL